MAHETAFLFPGQGSQTVGMGKDLYDAYPEAREVFDSVDAALGYPLSKVIFEGPEEDLKLTANTQPAILTVSSAMMAVLRKRGAATCDIVAGHSLGEYSAIVAAGGLSPTEAARLVNARGTFMQEAVPVGQGAMAAILGPTLDEIRSICEEASQGEVVSAANVNGPGQIVIAGTKTAVERAMEIAKGRGHRKAILLPVSAPFHCALMKPAEERLKPLLDAADFHDLAVPLVSNVDASPIGTAHAVRNALVRQVVSPVRWVESIERMVEMGVKRFVEVGPGSVLAGLVRRINKEIETVSVNSAESLEAWIAKSQENA